MEIFKVYETKILGFMIADLFSPADLDKIIRECTFVSYDYTGAGYLLEIAHPDLPAHRIVRDNPIVIGEAEDVTVGFAIFIENHRLCLECHSWGETNAPEHFRSYDVSVKAGKLKNGVFIEQNHSV